MKLAAGSKVHSLPSSSIFRGAPRLAAGRPGERAFAEETRARILVADQSAAGAGLHGEERGLAAIGARRAQQAIAGENGVERANEHRLDVHAGEVEIARIGADLMAGNFAEADEPQRARPTGAVLQLDAPAQDRALRIGAELHRRTHAVDRIADAEAVEADPFDLIIAGAPRRRPADRPRRIAVLAQIEEVAALLQRVERPAEKVDRKAAALVAGDISGAAAVAHQFDADRAVLAGKGLRPTDQRRRRARGGGSGMARSRRLARRAATSASAVAPAATPATP